MNKRGILYALALASLLAGTVVPMASRSYAGDAQYFPETGKSVGPKFFQYWDSHGALAQQGLPVSDEMQEQSDTDGKTYTVQYFERAVFEMHPENAPPYDVLLSLLGTSAYNGKYAGAAPVQKASTTNPRKFSETGKTIGGAFRTYWEQHGGLAQQGYPISDEFQEKSSTDGKTYTVQYFQRAVFEMHPEFAGTPNEVLLSLLGVFSYNSKHGAGGGGGTVVPQPSITVVPTPQSLTISNLTIAGWTNVAVATNNVAIFYNGSSGVGMAARVGADGTLTPLQQYPDSSKGLNGFEQGWTTIVAGPNKQIVFYSEKTGGFGLLSVADDGTSKWVTRFTTVTGFSTIVIDPTTGMMYYQNRTKGLTAVDLLKPDGTFANIKATAPDISGTIQDQYVPVGLFGTWLDYSLASGDVSTYKLNGLGN
ncbi:MAG: hypothetical protein M3014_13650, partial [Chloroflexota bacterium]|nr:hypothetical protein [Chloroflexota bacterium]